MALGKKSSTKMNNKQLSKGSFGRQNSIDFIEDLPRLQSSGSLKKRDSKRYSKNDPEDQARLLEYYNDLKTIQENKELPSRQVYLRRIGLNLVKCREDLYKFPILQSIEETSKIMLMNEFELLYWYDLMRTYLNNLKIAKFTQESVRLFFFLSAMFVKRFLYQQQMQYAFPEENMNRFKYQIESVEAYIKAYHYSNFDSVYKQFDRQEMILLDPQFRESGAEQIKTQMNHSYESFSYLSNISTRRIQELFNELRQPFETDNKINIIDYNWHVDGILKNSQSYNKENADKKENPTAKKITHEDQLQIQVKNSLQNQGVQIRPSQQNLLPGSNPPQQLNNPQLIKRRSNRDKNFHNNISATSSLPLGHHDSFLNQQIDQQTIQQLYQGYQNYPIARGLSNYPGLSSIPSIPYFSAKDSQFYPSENQIQQFMSHGGLQRNSSIRSTRSRQDEDEMYKIGMTGLASQNPSLKKPIGIKPMVGNHSSTNNLTDLQRNASKNAIGGEFDNKSISFSAAQIQNLHETLKNLKYDDDLQSPSLFGGIDRQQSASQFLIGGDMGGMPPNLGLNKSNSFLNNWSGQNNFILNREASAFQTLRVKDEKQGSETQRPSPELKLDKNFGSYVKHEHARYEDKTQANGRRR
ncbi:UNKNOWN [Stylonychia lemnae]|uniref:Uncharacterized protein n=1 Tax=Stylonychia lemnae TaxID=5949 RepID=A0A078ARA0_STYLE|nr:UNKNOWN [Stylonychia lemnae]|eukprot:CDW84749.1 UNKNOWN [Stylonychia lemnae]